MSMDVDTRRMNGDLLPEKVLEQILKANLCIDVDLFNDVSDDAFAKFEESSAAYVAVCRSWSRVAIPWLYETAIVRSTSQARVLANTLEKNPELGCYMKKLRVEGGYGQYMLTILKRTPNISHLSLSMDIWDPDTTEGLCSGLSLINPSCLALRDTGVCKGNEVVKKLVGALDVALVEWKNLTVFVSPYIDNAGCAGDVIASMSVFRRLQTVVVRNKRGAQWAYSNFIPCPLKSVRVMAPPTGKEDMGNDRLQALLTYDMAPDAPVIETIIPRKSRRFVPMAGQTEQLQDYIWSRILYFALEVEERRDGLYRNNYQKTGPSAYGYRQRVDPLLVSTRFLRLGIPHFYDTLLVPSRDDILEQYFPSYLYVEHLTARQIGTVSRFSMPQIAIPDTMISSLARSSGRTLVDLGLNLGHHNTINALELEQLPQLRVLRLRGHVRAGPVGEFRPHMLPRLEKLCVNGATNSFAQAVARMSLPCLSSLTFVFPATSPIKPGISGAEAAQSLLADVLKIHGDKLTQLTVNSFDIVSGATIDDCPKLEKIYLLLGPGMRPPRLGLLAPPRKNHLQLINIVLLPDLPPDYPLPVWFGSADSSSRRRPRALISPCPAAEWSDFLTQLDAATRTLLALQQVTFAWLAWPTTERDIAAEPWLPEHKILEALKVKLVDKNGKCWRARLI
ncbi:F-box domain-containing protein [Mycena indigotica]|uniref:F-box domain-containing protein n=1 Tax=Mycena indigotica TaxID=2126181 RepID=A0A8H6T1I7_9AGAR|nr:F-box domain-containing protein [Mycena indigotica]KAF7310310.1 F-box domain-containing protein [Mycena indigotica]